MRVALLFAVAAAAAALAAALSVAELDDYANGTRKRDESPALGVVHDHRVPLVFFLTFAGALPGSVLALAESRKRKRDRKALLVKYLQQIHRRSFPISSRDRPEPGMAPHVRVSLFTPNVEVRWRWPWHAGKIRWLWEKRRVLRCEHRTDSKTPKCPWALEGVEGLVVAAWRSQTNLSVRPPKKDDPNDQARYLKEAHMSEATRRDRSWPDAAMEAEPVSIGGIEPIAVLLVERNDGNAIACRELAWDARTLTMLLEAP